MVCGQISENGVSCVPHAIRSTLVSFPAEVVLVRSLSPQPQSARRKQDISMPMYGQRPGRLRGFLYTPCNVARSTPHCRVSQVSPRICLLLSCHRSPLGSPHYRSRGHHFLALAAAFGREVAAKPVYGRLTPSGRPEPRIIILLHAAEAGPRAEFSFVLDAV
jgi:hypothetical protein